MRDSRGRCRNIHRVSHGQQAGRSPAEQSFACSSALRRAARFVRLPRSCPTRAHRSRAALVYDPSFHRCAFLVSSAPFALLLVVCAAPAASRAQDSTATDRPWYDRLSIRGYAQFRYNRLLETNEQLKCSTCDRSIGDNGGFFLRRARLAISAQGERSHHDQHSAGLRDREVGGKENTLVLRHYYADIYLDSAKTFRARVGQSEVPTGFEALQSSSRRAPFDRSGCHGELGAWRTGPRRLFLLDASRREATFSRSRHRRGSRGRATTAPSRLGVYNGQGGNRAEMNDTPHVIARVAYPFRSGSRVRRGERVRVYRHVYDRAIAARCGRWRRR